MKLKLRTRAALYAIDRRKNTNQRHNTKRDNETRDHRSRVRYYRVDRGKCLFKVLVRWSFYTFKVSTKVDTRWKHLLNEVIFRFYK